METKNIVIAIAVIILAYLVYKHFHHENFANEHHHHKHHSHHEHHKHESKHHEHEKKSTPTCRNMWTAFDEDGGGNAVYLDRQNVACWNNENLSQFRLLRNYNSGMNKIQYNYKCCSHPDSPNKPSEWQCLNDIFTPLRKNANGDVECASVDGKNCLWENSFAGCQTMAKDLPKKLEPLACGEMHQKVYGDDGYDTVNHWCHIGYNELVNKGL